MKYKIIVDKKPRPTLTEERREYEIDIEELRYKGDVHDSLMINVDEAYVMRRLKLSEYQVLTVLDNPVKEPLGDLNIELFEGENYVYFLDMSGNIFNAEYIVKNEFNDLYVIYAQMNSAIEQSEKEIELNVSKILESYSTTEQMEASIKLLADNITLKVSNVEKGIEDVKSLTIAGVDIEYALGDSSTKAPETGWNTNAPQWENGKFVWQRTVTTYADGTQKTSDATCITGAKRNRWNGY